MYVYENVVLTIFLASFKSRNVMARPTTVAMTTASVDVSCYFQNTKTYTSMLAPRHQRGKSYEDVPSSR